MSEWPRGIDYAVTHNEVPPTARDLPSLIKQLSLLNIYDGKKQKIKHLKRTTKVIEVHKVREEF
ncbi:hypothetical protein CKAN_02090300 [Cinnamomum micranthum f. kanehirae]|uniref:Uncharacterized protein n=1 Tax=Cinnamomum micranthum f. kanehirae TaxID=337451 RepID=A0A3S3MXB7_9MAGN|nr:hypothetical protein CKAN_02090300 [Cinnamomum micranthum f. kanehirae]